MGTQSNASAGRMICEAFTQRGNMFRWSILNPITFEQLEARVLRSVSAMHTTTHDAVTSAVNETLQHAALGEEVSRVGELDLTFGNNGIAAADLLGPDSMRSVAVQSDGKIIVAGHAGLVQNSSAFHILSTHIAVARFNANGTLDTTFGDHGKVLLDVGGHSLETNVPMLLQADGKILVGGRGVHRLNTDGSLDTTFGVNGEIIAGSDTANMVLGPDGKITVGKSDDLRFMRFNSDGTFDNTFGGDGSISTNVGFGNVNVRQILLQGDGAMVVIGTRYRGPDEHPVILRYRVDGKVDRSFGNNGVMLEMPSSVQSFTAGCGALTPDGKMIVAGYVTMADHRSGTGMLRLNTDGSFDTTFGEGGMAYVPCGTEPHQMIMQPNGKMLIANGSGEMGVLQLSADGSLDTSFNHCGGFSTKRTSATVEAAYGLALQSDGSILVVGQVELANCAFQFPNILSECDAFVFRLHGDTMTPEPTPEPEPAPAPMPEKQHHHEHPEPDPVTPHDDHHNDGHGTVMRFIATEQASPFLSELANHRAVSLELLSGPADDRMFNELM